MSISESRSPSNSPPQSPSPLTSGNASTSYRAKRGRGALSTASASGLDEECERRAAMIGKKAIKAAVSGDVSPTAGRAAVSSASSSSSSASAVFSRALPTTQQRPPSPIESASSAASGLAISSTTSSSSDPTPDPLLDLWGTPQKPFNPNSETLAALLNGLKPENLQNRDPESWKEVLSRAGGAFFKETQNLTESGEIGLLPYVNAGVVLDSAHSSLSSRCVAFSSVAICQIAENFITAGNGADPQDALCREENFQCFFERLLDSQLTELSRLSGGKEVRFSLPFEKLIQSILSMDFPVTEKTIACLMEAARNSQNIAGVLLKQERLMTALSKEQVKELAVCRISAYVFAKDAENPVFRRHILNPEGMLPSLLKRAAEGLCGRALDGLLRNLFSFQYPQDDSSLFKEPFALLFSKIEENFNKIKWDDAERHFFLSACWERFGVRTFFEDPGILSKIPSEARAYALGKILSLGNETRVLEKMLRVPGYLDSLTSEDVKKVAGEMQRAILENNSSCDSPVYGAKKAVCLLLSQPAFRQKLTPSDLDGLLPLLCKKEFFNGSVEESAVLDFLKSAAQSSRISEKCCASIFSVLVEEEFSKPLVWGSIALLLLDADTVEMSDQSWDLALQYYEQTHWKPFSQDISPSLLKRLAGSVGPWTSQRLEKIQKMAALLFDSGNRQAVQLLQDFSPFFPKHFLETLFLKTVEKMPEAVDEREIQNWNLKGNKSPHGFLGKLHRWTQDSGLFASLSQEALETALAGAAQCWIVPLTKDLLAKGSGRISGAAVGKALASLNSHYLRLEESQSWETVFDCNSGDCEEYEEPGERWIEEIAEELFGFIKNHPEKEIPKDSLQEAIGKFTQRDAWLSQAMAEPVMQIVEYCSQKGWNDVWLGLPSEQRGRVLQMAARRENQNVFSLFVQNPAFLEKIPNRFFDSQWKTVEQLKEAGWTGCLEEIEEEENNRRVEE